MSPLAPASPPGKSADSIMSLQAPLPVPAFHLRSRARSRRRTSRVGQLFAPPSVKQSTQRAFCSAVSTRLLRLGSFTVPSAASSWSPRAPRACARGAAMARKALNSVAKAAPATCMYTLTLRESGAVCVPRPAGRLPALTGPPPRRQSLLSANACHARG